MAYRNRCIVLFVILVLLSFPFVTAAQRDPLGAEDGIQRLMNEGFNEGNLAVIDELFAENFTIHPSGDGRSAFKESAIALRGMFPDIYAQADQIVVQGNWASFHFNMSGTFANPYVTSQGSIAPTGEFASITMNVFLRYDDEGKVAEEWDYFDNYGFLTQIGVLEGVQPATTTEPSLSLELPTVPAKIPSRTSPNAAVANKASVQRVFDELLNLRIDNVEQELFASDFVYHGVSGTQDLATWNTRLSHWLAAAPDLLVTPELMLADDHLVSVR